MSETVEGTISDLNLDNYVEDSQLEGFLESLDCEFEIKVVKNYTSALCQVCGSDYLLIEGRCTTCLACGWSKCSI